MRAISGKPSHVVAVFAGIGLTFMAVGAWLLHGSLAAKRWPTTPGVVTTSRIDESTSKGRVRYACKVYYRFDVRGKAFRGERLHPMNVYGGKSGAQEDLLRYPPGGACTVHYNPEDPADSCLEPSSGVMDWWILAVGSLLTLGTLGGSLYLRSRSAKR